MGARYTTILVGGEVSTYNDSPPADNGAATAANRVKFATVTSDLTAPLHSAITRLDGKLVDLADEGPDVHTTTYTTVASDFAKVLECSGTFTVSLQTPAAGYRLTVKNDGVGTITVNVNGGADVDGAASQTISAGASAAFIVNAAGTAYYSIWSRGYNPA